MGTVILNPFEIFGDALARAAVLNGTDYGDFGVHSEFELQNFEIEIKIRVTDVNDNKYRRFFTTWGGVGGFTAGIIRSGLSPGPDLFLAFKHLGGSITIRSGEVVSDDSTNVITIKKYSGIVRLILNGSTVQVSSSQTIRYESDPFQTGAILSAGQGGSNDTFYLKYWELSSDGSSRIKSYIDTDIDNGDADTIPNVGADKPASSDWIWTPAGSGTYVDV